MSRGSGHVSGGGEGGVVERGGGEGGGGGGVGGRGGGGEGVVSGKIEILRGEMQEGFASMLVRIIIIMIINSHVHSHD